VAGTTYSSRSPVFIELDGKPVELPSAERVQELDEVYRKAIHADATASDNLEHFATISSTTSFAACVREAIDDIHEDGVRTDEPITPTERMWLLVQLWRDVGGRMEYINNVRPKSFKYYEETMRHTKHVPLLILGVVVQPLKTAPFNETLNNQEIKMLDNPTPKFPNKAAPTTRITKEPNMLNKIIEDNKSLAVSGAYLEAGRVANNQITKLIAKKAPMMVRGYVETAVGRLVIANIAKMAVEHFRPEPALVTLTNSMVAKAYQEMIEDLDIEGMLDELLSDPKVKSAISKVTPNHKDKPVRAADALAQD
jgi:hypothetical protein